MPHNERFPAQWKLIKKHIDFDGKYVLDLGCGYGDLAAQCWLSGADVIGFDQDADIIRAARSNLFERNMPQSIVWLGNITDLGPSYDAERWDVIVCFSVLPYLEDKEALLEWIRDHCDTALFEIQSKGDGPGIMTYDEIKQMLLNYWNHVIDIGSTLVQYRNMRRHIWLCR